MAAGQRWTYRYSALVRVAHWVNVLCVAILVMSGLQVFNAHPALYWGEDSDFERPLLAISTVFTPEGRPIGVTRLFGRSFETTGFPACRTNTPSSRKVDLSTGVLT